MNCQEFSEHATEMARAQLVDAAARDGALRHASGCGACAARLERERALSAALRATAESFGGAAAPARVESALLAAFRAERDAASTPVTAQPLAPANTQPLIHASTRANVHAFASRFGRRARVAFAASAVAASLIAAFVVFKRAPQRVEPPTQIAAGQSDATTQQSSVVRGETELTSEQQSPPQQAAPGAESSEGDETGRRLNDGIERRKPVRLQRAAGGQQKKALGGTALAFNIDGGRAVFAEGDAATAATETAGLRGDEAALTDFVPLAAGANSAPLDGGQVVRVEAPRAALASLGLPVDARRADEKVKADLLLAHDGTAHAIRFVR